MLESLMSLARSYTRYYDSSSVGWIVVILVVALIAILCFLRFVPLGLWITSLAAGVHVSIASLVGMRLRRIQPKRLVEPLIKARKAGLNLTLCWWTQDINHLHILILLKRSAAKEPVVTIVIIMISLHFQKNSLLRV